MNIDIIRCARSVGIAMGLALACGLAGCDSKQAPVIDTSVPKDVKPVMLRRTASGEIAPVPFPAARTRRN